MSSQTESDVILNRANIALARSQRLVASWLPAQTAEEVARSTKSEEELQREEDEIFTPVPETLGVGATCPEKTSDGSWNRAELDSNDKLRRQLLGKNYQKVMMKDKKVGGVVRSWSASTSTSTSISTSTPGSGNPAGKSEIGSAQTDTNHQQKDEDEDEEEGRVALVGNGKKRRKREAGSGSHPDQVRPRGLSVDDDGIDIGSEIESTQSRPGKSKKKATSYLDAILADRAKRKKR